MDHPQKSSNNFIMVSKDPITDPYIDTDMDPDDETKNTSKTKVVIDKAILMEAFKRRVTEFIEPTVVDYNIDIFKDCEGQWQN